MKIMIKLNFFFFNIKTDSSTGHYVLSNIELFDYKKKDLLHLVIYSKKLSSEKEFLIFYIT